MRAHLFLRVAEELDGDARRGAEVVSRSRVRRGLQRAGTRAGLGGERELAEAARAARADAQRLAHLRDRRAVQIDRVGRSHVHVLQVDELREPEPLQAHSTE